MAAFTALAAATIGAFFIVQHLKVTTPLLSGYPAPDPAVINPVYGGTCGGVDHRHMSVSFYLLHRSDDVDVYIVNQSGAIAATLATNRYMQARPPRRMAFTWDGREDNGRLAPDGLYYIHVDLVHQGRTVVISNQLTGAAEPVRVQSTIPAPRVTAVDPRVIPQGGSADVTIHYTGTEGRAATVLLYRTGSSSVPSLVKAFLISGAGGQATWDGKIHGRPAAAGTYLVGLRVTDAACVTAQSPLSRAGSASPPLVTVDAGAPTYSRGQVIRPRAGSV